MQPKSLAPADCMSRINDATTYIKNQISAEAKFEIGIVCGSGLGGLASTLDNVTSIDYANIPHFASTTVSGHSSKLVHGLLEGKAVLCLVGRFHFYEGHHLADVIFPIRVLGALGINILITTNAAGGLNPDYNVGDVMVIEDHISLPNLAGIHPLIGPNLEELGPRFPSTSDAYDIELRRLAFAAVERIPSSKGKLTLREGIYVNVCGPSYETRAESRFLRMVGADVVGMSTIPEVIAAKHCGIKVLGLSLVTNNVIITRQAPSTAPPSAETTKEVHASHEEVLATSQAKALLMQDLVRNIVASIGTC